MNIFEWNRRRILERIVEMSMKHGVSFHYTKPYYSFNNPELKLSVPEYDTDRTIENRHKAARTTIKTLSKDSTRELRYAYRLARRAVKDLDIETELYNRVDEEAVSALRTEAMVTLLRTGREDHPAYAMLAEASTISEIKSIRIRAERMQLER